MGEQTGRVEGKVAIVTGAGSTPGPGIGTGKASAVVLAREGASVLLVDLYPERAEETRQMIAEEGGKAEVFAADVTKASGCEAMVKAAVDAFGTVNILVNNVGLASLGTVVDITEEAWDRAMDVNLRRARSFRPSMRFPLSPKLGVVRSSTSPPSLPSGEMARWPIRWPRGVSSP